MDLIQFWYNFVDRYYSNACRIFIYFQHQFLCVILNMVLHINNKLIVVLF